VGARNEIADLGVRVAPKITSMLANFEANSAIWNSKIGTKCSVDHDGWLCRRAAAKVRQSISSYDGYDSLADLLVQFRRAPCDQGGRHREYDSLVASERRNEPLGTPPFRVLRIQRRTADRLRSFPGDRRHPIRCGLVELPRVDAGARPARALLTRLGYEEKAGAFRQPERKAVFVGLYRPRPEDPRDPSGRPPHGR